MTNKYSFITDRSQDHVARLKRLRSIGWYNMSDSQKAEYTDYAAKGAYNYTDLNRVEQAVGILADRLGLTLTIKLDWNRWQSFTESDMQRYLGNIVAIVNKFGENHDISDFPSLPDSMNHFTWMSANNIEKTLEIMFDVLQIVKPVSLGEFLIGRDTLNYW